MTRYYESDLIDEVYDVLFKNTQHTPIDFCEEFPDAEVSREFAYIKLNDKFAIKVERI